MSAEDILRLARVFEHTAVGMAIQSPKGVWLEVNPAFCHLVGRSRDQLVGFHFRTITHEDDLDRSLMQLERLNTGEVNSFRFDKRYWHEDGREVWVRLDVSMVRRDDGKPDFIITQVQDITASRQIRQALADSEARLQSIITTMAEGMVVHGPDGRIVLGNQRASEILGVAPEILNGADPYDLKLECIGPDGAAVPPECYPAAITRQTGQPRREDQLGIRRSEGELVWIEISTEPVREESGEVVAVVSTFSDITRRLKIEQALKDSEERLSLALEGAKLGMWDWRLSSGEVRFSRAAYRMLGFERHEIDSRMDAVIELFHPEDRDRVGRRIEEHLRGQRTFFDSDFRMRSKAGGYIWVLARGRVTQRDRDNRPVRVSGTLMDISQWKELEGKLIQMATTDPLTGLFNRRHATECLERERQRSERSGEPFSLVLLDIDHFKNINDSLGHDAGDQVLMQLAGMIGERIRSTDVAARWGGEEFAIVLPDTALEGGRQLAGELLECMAGLDETVPDGLSASFGVVEFRKGEAVADLLKRADRLMYRAKESGRSRVEAEA